MQRSHLIHVTVWEWINGRNLKIKTDDHELLLGSLDPPDVDPQGNAIWAEWKNFKLDNLWLEDVAADLREDFLLTARRAVG